MAASPADERGEATAAAPDTGTTEATATPTSQSASAGTAAAPNTGTTADDVLHASVPTAAKGQPATEDKVKALHDKLAYVQPKADAFEKTMARMKERYPDDFDEDGNLVEGAAHAAPRDQSVLHASAPAGAPEATARPEGKQFGFDALHVDSGQARLEQMNAKAMAAIYEDENVVGPVRAILLDTLAEMGVTPQTIQAMSQGGRGGLDETQLRELTTDITRQQIQSHQQWQKQWRGQVEACKATYPGLLSKLIDWPDTPKQTIEDALERICQETGEANPHFALLKHATTAPVANQLLVERRAKELAAKMIASGQGMQLMPAGGGFPGPQRAGTNEIESIGGSTEPLKR